jgi:hypothetical protein
VVAAVKAVIELKLHTVKNDNKRDAILKELFHLDSLGEVVRRDISKLTYSFIPQEERWAMKDLPRL